MKNWKKHLKEIHKSGDCCGCYEGDLGGLYLEAHKKLENSIEQLISERDGLWRLALTHLPTEQRESVLKTLDGLQTLD